MIMTIKIAKVGDAPAVNFAAEELKRCLTGMDPAADVSIMAFVGNDPTRDGILWLGVCPEIRETVENPVLDDAYRIDVIDGVGAIRGSNGRSVLFGVYRYLKELGCTWVRPGADGEYIPRKCLSNTEVHVNEKASYRHRGV